MNTKTIEDKAERKTAKRAARKKAAPIAKRAASVNRGDKHVEIAPIIEYSGIHQLELGIEARSPAVLLNQPRVRKLLLRILVQRLHVRMRRCVVQIEVAFLYIFSMIAFLSVQSKEPLFEKRIMPIPHSRGKADE